jgi:hypothetical protein
VPAFERISKRAVIISAVAITALQIGIHPDMTPGLRLLCTLCGIAGWLAGGSSRGLVQVAWVFAGVLAPAILRLAAGREGTVLDSFWMTGLTASLLRSSSWSRWSLDAGTRTLAAGWGLTIALAWPILSAREAGFDWRLLFDLGAINTWCGWSAPHAASWIGFVAWTHLLGLLWLDWLTARLDADPARRLPGVIHGFWIAGTLASLPRVAQSTRALRPSARRPLRPAPSPLPPGRRRSGARARCAACCPRWRAAPACEGAGSCGRSRRRPSRSPRGGPGCPLFKPGKRKNTIRII